MAPAKKTQTQRQIARARKGEKGVAGGLTVRIDPSLIKPKKSAEELQIEAKLAYRPRTPEQVAELERAKKDHYYRPAHA